MGHEKGKKPVEWHPKSIERHKKWIERRPKFIERRPKPVERRDLSIEQDTKPVESHPKQLLGTLVGPGSRPGGPAPGSVPSVIRCWCSRASAELPLSRMEAMGHGLFQDLPLAGVNLE